MEIRTSFRILGPFFVAFLYLLEVLVDVFPLLLAPFCVSVISQPPHPG